jgi:predicted CXXCH cytochrome family protein
MNSEPEIILQRLTLTALLLVLCGVSRQTLAQRMPEPRGGPSVASQSAVLGKPGDYVGWETCAGCHRAEAQSFMKTVHAPAGGGLPTAPTAFGPSLSPSAAAGKKIYDDMVCAGCHKIGGQGGEGGPALDDVGARLTREEVTKRMVGRRAGTVMPPLPPDMPDQKINELVDYMMTLKGQTAAATKVAAATAPPFKVTGCETCHGPGKAHVDAEQDAAGDPAKEMAGAKLIFTFHASPKENSERCLSCHITSQHQEIFDHSQHFDVGVSCNECHASHLVKAQAQALPNVHYPQAVFFQVPEMPEMTRWLHSALLKQAQPNLCFRCHGNVQAQFALPVHHPVPEQLMKCSDCHSPHGSINRANLNSPLWETCFNCHVEKRGPYVYEHAAVRVEGCAVCHNPHGSTNHFMLVRREGRQLCLQCHTGFHGQAGVPHGRLGFQTSGECTRCHVTIHGSNLDTNFLR